MRNVWGTKNMRNIFFLTQSRSITYGGSLLGVPSTTTPPSSELRAGSPSDWNRILTSFASLITQPAVRCNDYKVSRRRIDTEVFPMLVVTVEIGTVRQRILWTFPRNIGLIRHPNRSFISWCYKLELEPLPLDFTSNPFPIFFIEPRRIITWAGINDIFRLGRRHANKRNQTENHQDNFPHAVHYKAPFTTRLVRSIWHTKGNQNSQRLFDCTLCWLQSTYRKPSNPSHLGRWFSDWNYLFGDLMGVNANPEETDELVKDFQDSEAAKEMLDETDWFVMPA